MYVVYNIYIYAFYGNRFHARVVDDKFASLYVRPSESSRLFRCCFANFIFYIFIVAYFSQPFFHMSVTLTMKIHYRPLHIIIIIRAFHPYREIYARAYPCAVSLGR